MFSEDATQLGVFAQFFMTTLIYHTLAGQMGTIIADHGGSITVLTLTFLAIAVFVSWTNLYIKAWQAQLDPHSAPGLKLSIAKLLVFDITLLGLVVASMSGQLVSEMLTAALSTTDPLWAIFGAIISFHFVFILIEVSSGPPQLDTTQKGR